MDAANFRKIFAIAFLLTLFLLVDSLSESKDAKSNSKKRASHSKKGKSTKNKTGTMNFSFSFRSIIAYNVLQGIIKDLCYRHNLVCFLCKCLLFTTPLHINKH